jgi:3'-phosphoadenosine 5'-phosphosulfate sulfotransferase (PAPS reductase)/FAD synthetase
MQQTLCLFEDVAQCHEAAKEGSSPDIESYERFVVVFSGGKDASACVLHLLELGVARDKIELHHHCVDGRVDGGLMDWPVTESYCRAFAKALGVEIYFSWRDGGFEREMLRDESATAAVHFERPDGSIATVGGEGPLGTRQRFPQVSADLSVRWCSAYLKVDVGACLLRNEDRFNGSRTLVVTGERAEESRSRARYKSFERHRSDTRDGKKKRHVDHWRPVHAWKEAAVWAIIERHKIRPHPAYFLSFSRTSCMKCIFGSAAQWATVAQLDTDGFKRIAAYERRFGTTIQRKESVEHLAARGKAFRFSDEDARMAMSRHFDAPIIVENWVLPAGAFGEGTGPT